MGLILHALQSTLKEWKFSRAAPADTLETDSLEWHNPENLQDFARLWDDLQSSFGSCGKLDSFGRLVQLLCKSQVDLIDLVDFFHQCWCAMLDWTYSQSSWG